MLTDLFGRHPGWFILTNHVNGLSATYRSFREVADQVVNARV